MMGELLTGLRAAAEPTRLRMLVLCARADLTVSELVQILGQSQPRVSRHLKLLGEAGLLERASEGPWAYFRLSDQPPGAALARTLVDMLPAQDETIAGDLVRLEEVRRARAQSAAEYFRRNAADWDELRSLHADDGEVERVLAETLPEDLGDLLDVGTGTGRMLQLLGPRARRAVGIDSSREMLAIARAALDRSDLRHCAVRQADMYQLPMPAGSFDTVIVHQVLHYAERPRMALREAARVLRPGGRLVIVDFAPHMQESLRRDHAHRWLGFPDDEISQWCASAGLSLRPVRHLPGRPLTVTVWHAVRRAAPQPALEFATVKEGGGR